MFEAVQFIEYRGVPDPAETPLGDFDEEMDAVEVARQDREAFMETGADEYAWWIVRSHFSPKQADYDAVDLPRPLRGLYYLVRPVRLAFREGQALLRRIMSPSRTG